VLACIFRVFGMLRRSAPVPGSSSVAEGRKHLRRPAVALWEGRFALRPTLTGTKTLQFKERKHVLCMAGCKGGTS
jgi:hypothetical protein